MKNEFQYIFGPVFSWRLGRSLGVDPISAKAKICDFDCAYCQLGKTVHFSQERKVYIPAEDIISEVKRLDDVEIDYITFSGIGEPTLAKNLGDMIKGIKAIRPEKIAVITNSSLLHESDVRRDLQSADFVLAKLDACNQESFLNVNQAMDGQDFNKIVSGIKAFNKEFKGKLALQIMFIEANRYLAGQIADIAREINADEIEINTPLRPSAVAPLNEETLIQIKEHFKGLPAKTVYEYERKTIEPLDERDTMKRHGI